MRRAEGVVLALCALGEARQPAARAQRADAVATPRQDLVRIALVADVPYQPVARRVEDRMDRHGQLDHAEAGAEMAAGDRDGRDRLGAQVVGDGAQLGRAQAAQVGGLPDPVQMRRLRAGVVAGHGFLRRPLAGRYAVRPAAKTAA